MIVAHDIGLIIILLHKAAKTQPDNITFIFCFIEMDTDDEQVLNLLVESFLLNGRVTNINVLMAYHPQYLEYFLRTEYYMFKGEGPLPFDWRCYIAIMV